MQTIRTIKENQHENICEELLRERAAVLSRAGFALEDAIGRLISVEREIERKLSILESYRVAAHDHEISRKQELLHEEINRSIDRFNSLWQDAQLRHYYLIVTREALGLRRHDAVNKIYRIPPKKKKQGRWNG